MKKKISMLLIIVLLITLVGCSRSKPSGKYADDIGFSTLDFKGDSVTMESGTFSPEITKGKVKMVDGNVEIEWEDGAIDTLTYDKETDTLTLAGVLTWTKVK